MHLTDNGLAYTLKHFSPTLPSYILIYYNLYELLYIIFIVECWANLRIFVNQYKVVKSIPGPNVRLLLFVELDK